MKSLGGCHPDSGCWCCLGLACAAGMCCTPSAGQLPGWHRLASQHAPLPAFWQKPGDRSYE